MRTVKKKTAPSKKPVRRRAPKRWKRSKYRRFLLPGMAAALLGAAGWGVWFWKDGGVERLSEASRQKVYTVTASFGMTVQNIYLEGREKADLALVQRAIDVSRGEPLLAVSVGEIKQRLEQIGWVEHAAVSRELPGTLHIRLAERQPVALWQYQGKLKLIDGNGVAIETPDFGRYSHLPVVVGGDAPKYAFDLLVALSSDRELFGKVASAVRVGERRWNVRLSNGMSIKLPEEDPETAWKLLAKLQREQHLLDRDIKMVDLRLSDRIYIQPVSELSKSGQKKQNSVQDRDT